jgi:hypothetical protein
MAKVEIINVEPIEILADRLRLAEVADGSIAVGDGCLWPAEQSIQTDVFECSLQ